MNTLRYNRSNVLMCNILHVPSLTGQSSGIAQF